MPGVLVVTHGQFAEELVKAARTIVGEIADLEAVSIGWNDDAADATRRIDAAIRRVDRGKGVLLLTDMFGGTPTNLALSMMEPRRIEIVTGVNLPMLIKCSNLREERDIHETAVLIAVEAREAIHVATRLLDSTPDAGNGEPG